MVSRWFVRWFVCSATIDPTLFSPPFPCCCRWLPWLHCILCCVSISPRVLFLVFRPSSCVASFCCLPYYFSLAVWFWKLSIANTDNSTNSFFSVFKKRKRRSESRDGEESKRVESSLFHDLFLLSAKKNWSQWCPVNVFYSFVLTPPWHLRDTVTAPSWQRWNIVEGAFSA